MFLEHLISLLLREWGPAPRGNNLIPSPFVMNAEMCIYFGSFPLRRRSKGDDFIKHRALDRRTHSDKYRAPAVYDSQPGWRDGSAGVFRELLRTAVACIG
jgi:hypothetical protein